MTSFIQRRNGMHSLWWAKRGAYCPDYPCQSVASIFRHAVFPSTDMFQIGSEDRLIGEIRRWRSKKPKTQTLGCDCLGSPQDGFEGHKLLHKVTGFGGFGIYVFHQFSSAGHPAIRQHHRKIKADVFSISDF